MFKKFIKNFIGDFIKFQKNDKDRFYIIENFEQMVRYLSNE